jgi:hypothetical protein
LLAVLTGLVVLQPGCSPSPSPRPAPVLAARGTLSPGEAATLAARLANDQCESRYNARPFSPGQYPAVLQEGTYRWGGLDVGGPGGFSAFVTFGKNGEEPHVEVYFSSDALRPQRLPPPPARGDAPRVK